MLWLKVLALLISGLSNIFVGVVVLLRGYNRLSNVSFFALATSMAGWTIGIAFFLLTKSPHAAFLWAKVYYLFPLIVAVALVLFVKSFPENKRVSKVWVALLVIAFFALALPLIVFHGFVTERLVYHTWC